MSTVSSKIDWQEESKRFDGVAEGYDAYRPGGLVTAVTSLLPRQNGRILEIGSGTGIATALFALHGYAILCVEPGENLVSVARRKLKEFPRVEFETVRFESWRVCPQQFDLAISAQAFHWVPKDVGYARAAQALKSDGHLALFWNMYPFPKGAVFEALDKVYQECVPELAAEDRSHEPLLKQRADAIKESGYFDNVQVNRFPWAETYSTAQYLGLLNTYSDHLRLSEKEQAHLYNGVADVIERHGGTIEKPYLAVLYTAVKAA